MEDTHNLVVAVRKYAASLSVPRRGTRYLASHHQLASGCTKAPLPSAKESA